MPEDSKKIEEVSSEKRSNKVTTSNQKVNTNSSDKNSNYNKGNNSENNNSNSKRISILDDAVDQNGSTSSSTSITKKVRGMATVESTLNSMTGDISYEELSKIPGISTMALKAKENVSDISIFQKKDYVSSINNCPISDISYTNIPLLSKFISANGRIVPSRISTLDHASQKQLERCIKLARFLGFLPYVEY